MVESIGATLWNPLEIIEANGGFPPLTYAQFCHISKAVGKPQKPRPDVDLSKVELVGLATFYVLPFNFDFFTFYLFTFYLFTFDLSKVELIDLATNENLISEKLTLFPTTPSPEMVGIERDPEWKERKVFVGGERKALKYLGKRIEHETKAFKEGSFLPNRKDLNLKS